MLERLQAREREASVFKGELPENKKKFLTNELPDGFFRGLRYWRIRDSEKRR
jgi:hypothetical protein